MGLNFTTAASPGLTDDERLASLQRGYIRTGMEDVAYTASGSSQPPMLNSSKRAVSMCEAVGRPVPTRKSPRALGPAASARVSSIRSLDRSAGQCEIGVDDQSLCRDAMRRVRQQRVRLARRACDPRFRGRSRDNADLASARHAVEAMRSCEEALRAGVFAQAIRPPTVSNGTSRHRVVVSAGHGHTALRTAARVFAGTANAARSATVDSNAATVRQGLGSKGFDVDAELDI